MLKKLGEFKNFLSGYFGEMGRSPDKPSVMTNVAEQEFNASLRVLGAVIEVFDDRLRNEEFKVSDVNFDRSGNSISMFDRVKTITELAGILGKRLDDLTPHMSADVAHSAQDGINRIMGNLRGILEELPKYSQRAHVHVLNARSTDTALYEGNIKNDINLLKETAMSEIGLVVDDLKKRSQALTYVGTDFDHPMSSGVSV